MKTLEKILLKYAAPLLLLLLTGWFAIWAFGAGYSAAAMFAAAFSAVLLGLSLAKLPASFWQDITEPAAEIPAGGIRTGRFERRHPWVSIALCVIGLHLLLYIMAYCYDLAKFGYTGGILDTAERLWSRSDAPHYQGIAENWYVTEGDARLHIVFFPLYPLLTKVFSFITGSSFASAMLVSNLCAIGGGILAYELAAIHMERRDALFAAAVLQVFPGSFFLAAPMTESLFLLLSLSCMLCAIKKRYLLAGMFGALAAFTRSVGLLLIVPIFIEAAADICRDRSMDRTAIAKRAGGTALVILGTAAYLLVNKLATGSAFTFLTYQSEHWNQRLGPFFGTAAYHTDLMLTSLTKGDIPMVMGLFLPNLLCCFAFLGILLACAKKLRPSYLGYALIYFAVATGCTWLLSGPRYLAVCFPIAFGIAALTKGKKALRTALLILLCILMLIYLWMFVMGYPVY